MTPALIWTWDSHRLFDRHFHQGALLFAVGYITLQPVNGILIFPCSVFHVLLLGGTVLIMQTYFGLPFVLGQKLTLLFSAVRLGSHAIYILGLSPIPGWT
jgi:hypothetical protein